MPQAQQFISGTETLERVVEREEPAPPVGERLARTCRLLWDERRFLLRILLAALVGSIVLSLIWPPTYESTALLIPSAPPSIGALANLGQLGNLASLATGGGDLLGVRTSSPRFVAILRSRTVADRLIDRFGLMKVYGARLRESARQSLANHTIIVEDRKTGLITLTVRDRDRYRAAQMAEGYVAELDRLSSELNMGAAHRERLFLDERVAEVKTQLDAAARKLADFSSSHGVMAVDEQAKMMMESAARLQGQLAALEAQRQGLEQIYTPKNVRVRETQAQITALKQQLLKLRGSAQAADSPPELLPSLTSLPTLGVTYADLWRENKILNTVYEVLTQQLELARVEEAKELPTVRVMDRPNIAELRTSPRRKLIVLVSCLMSLLLGVGWILSREKWRETDDRDSVKSLLMEMRDGIRRSRSADRLRGARILVLRRVQRFGSSRNPA